MGDLHIGHRGFQRALFRDQVKDILDDPAALVVLTGDLIENVTRGSVGDLYEDLEIVNPQDQADDAVDELMPIASRIIGAVRGNHEYRTPKDMGIDPMAYICRSLNAPYFRDSVLLCLRFGHLLNGKPLLYTVYLSHLSGGAGSDGGKVNAGSKMASIVVADVCIGGHTHMGATHKRAIWVPNLQNRQVLKREIQIVNAGTYQDTSGWGERKSFAPVVLGSPVISLSGRRRRTRCTVG